MNTVEALDEVRRREIETLVRLNDENAQDWPPPVRWRPGIIPNFARVERHLAQIRSTATWNQAAQQTGETSG